MGLIAQATTQECTQIGETGPSVPFWGIRVHCCAVGLGCGWPWDRNSVHKWEDRVSRCRFGAFVYTVATREDRASDRGDSQECTQIGETGLSDPFRGTCVHCCDASFTMRITSGGTSTSTTMACRWRPLAGRLSLGREDRPCASGAAVRLASSPRQQPTQIPDGPGSSGLYEGREGRPPREGPVTLDLLTRWPRHPAPIQSGA